MGITSTPSTTAASAALSAGTSSPRRPFCVGRGHGHRQRALGRPRRAVQGQLADDGVLLEQLGGRLAAAQEDAQGDGQIERRGVLGHVGRGEVDDDAVLRPLKARIDDRPLDAMGAFLDGRLGQADDDCFGRPLGETSTSTSTGRASMPTKENVWSLASMVWPVG